MINLPKHLHIHFDIIVCMEIHPLFKVEFDQNYKFFITLNYIYLFIYKKNSKLSESNIESIEFDIVLMPRMRYL